MKNQKLTLVLASIFVMIALAGCSHRVVLVSELFPEYHPDTMKLFYIKEKAWTFNDSFDIKDRNREPVYKVKGKLFSFGDSLRLFDMDGQELLHIRQRVISFTSRYHISKEKRLYGKMVEIVKLFKDKYYLQVTGGPRYIIKGDFTAHRYSIYRGNKRVAYISRKWFKWTEHYTVVVVPEEDEELMLSAVIVVDMVNKQKK